MTWDLKCKQCGCVISELLDGRCWRCNPELAVQLEQRRQRNEQRKELYFALRSRVLTLEEMEKVESMGYTLVTNESECYKVDEAKAEFSAALLQQFKMRLAAEYAAKGETK